MAQISSGVVLSNLGMDALPLDILLNKYSPTRVDTVNWTVAANPNTHTIPDATNTRGLIVWLPQNNVQTCILKLLTGDTGVYVNPQGKMEWTFDPNHMPTALYATVGGTINGVSLIWW